MTTSPDDPVLLARQAVDGVHTDPERARSVAREVLAAPDISPEATAIATWALALVARQMNELDDAEAGFLAAMGVAETAGLRGLAAEIRSSHALLLLYLGKTDAALAAAVEAGAVLTGAPLARNTMQTALILQRMGRLDEALDRYRNALTGLRRHGDRVAEARLLINRGVLHGFRGAVSAGVADLRSAVEIAEDLGQDLLVAGATHNLGFLESRRGDVPAALAAYAEARAAYDRLGRPPGMFEVLEANRAEVLLDVGLASEAEAVIGPVVDEIARLGNQTDLAEVYLTAAQVALGNESPQEAVARAHIAAEAFRSQGRTRWALEADTLALRAAFDLHDPNFGARADVLVTELRDAGLNSHSSAVLALAVRAALWGGDTTKARQLLEGVDPRKTSGAVPRSRAWLSVALLREAEGDRAGARRAVSAGLRVLETHRVSLGASELRAQSVSQTGELVRIGVRLALESGDARSVFASVERWRGLSSIPEPVRPGDDRTLESLLTALRILESDEREGGDDDSRGFQRRRADLERRIRDHVRTRRSDGAGSLAVDVGELAARLGDRVLVSYFTHEDMIHAVRLCEGRLRLFELADASAAADEVASMVFSLHRLALSRGSQASMQAAVASVDESSRALSRMLVEPVRLDGRPAVVVPTGALHRCPWTAVRGFDAGVSVVPSARSWLRAAGVTRRSPRSALVVAGPDLAHATGEVGSIGGMYLRSSVLVGASATVDNVRAGLGNADIGHIAAHGRFRADNALFSSLRLHDGPLTVYDLQQTALPKTLVLPSCDTAVSEVIAGDEILGLAGATLQMGVRTLVAPVVPVSDEATAQVMEQFHRHVVGGHQPVDAVGALPGIDADPGDRPDLWAAARSFVSLGA